MRIGIIGGGAVGLLIGSYLSEKHQITIYVRRDQQKHLLNQHGIIRDNDKWQVSVRALLLEEIEKEDCFIVCVKQYHLETILSKLMTINDQPSVIFLQNGLGHLKVAETLKQPVIFGVVEHGSLRINDYMYRHTGKGLIKLANFHGDEQCLQKLMEKLNYNHFPMILVNDWQQMLYEKLIVNAVINPLTAIFQVVNGELLKNTYLNQMAEELCKEISVELGLDPDKHWQHVLRVAEKTGENTSSMLKDILEDRQTEVDAILGYILKQTKNKKMPYTRFVYSCVKALEVKKGIIG